MARHRRSTRKYIVASPSDTANDAGSQSSRRSSKKRAGIREANVAESSAAASISTSISNNRETADITYSQADIIKAVGSLYDDKLRPYGRFLRKRLVEFARSNEVEDAQEPDATRLRSFCLTCHDLCVESEPGGEWTVFLTGRAKEFVDFYDLQTDYPQDLWTAAGKYFRGLVDKGQDASLPGGRYSSAHALVERKLPFLHGYSLGHVCHIIQLAIAKHKLLGYRNGAVVPYSLSTSMTKRMYADRQEPLKLESNGIIDECSNLLPVVDWDQAKEYMIEILKTKIGESNAQVPLSNIKRIFRSSYKCELSETSLGYTKLSELLQDPRFKDICTVQLHERGYIVVPKPELPLVTEESKDLAVADETKIDDVVLRDTTIPHLRSSELLELPTSTFAHTVKHTFIHAHLPPPTPPAGHSLKRSHSLPRDHRPVPEPLACGQVAHTKISEEIAVKEVGEQERRFQFCVDEPLCLDDLLDEQPLTSSPFLPTPSPGTFLQCDDGWAWEQQVDVSCRLPFCVGEPLELDEAFEEYNDHGLANSVVTSPALPFPTCTPSPSPLRPCAPASFRQRSGIPLHIACYV